MTTNIKGLEKWEEEASAYSRKAGDLKMQAGAGLLSAVENWYSQWKQNPKHGRARREYMTWRLRLHRRWNHDPAFLEELDEYFEIGLHDSEPGDTFWHIEPEEKTSLTTGFNWRRDSGDAIAGRRARKYTSRDKE